MRRFHIPASMGGKPINLTIEEIPGMQPSDHAFFNILKGKKPLAMIKMDGECNLLSFLPGEFKFTEEESQKICKEIFTYLKKDDRDLTIIYL